MPFGFNVTSKKKVERMKVCGPRNRLSEFLDKMYNEGWRCVFSSPKRIGGNKTDPDRVSIVWERDELPYQKFVCSCGVVLPYQTKEQLLKKLRRHKTSKFHKKNRKKS